MGTQLNQQNTQQVIYALSVKEPQKTAAVML